MSRISKLEKDKRNEILKELKQEFSVRQIQRMTKIKNADSGKFETKDLKFYPERKWEEDSIDLGDHIEDAIQS